MNDSKGNTDTNETVEWRAAISKAVLRLTQCVARMDRTAFSDIDLTSIIEASEGRNQ